MESLETTMAEMALLRLPELRAQFEEIVGETTRCPNKRYLLRRIKEALIERADQASEEDAMESVQESEEDVIEPAQGAEEDAIESVQEAEEGRGALRRLDIDALREKYVEVIGRQTSSRNQAYLVWKIRQAQRGLVPVGARSQAAGRSELPHKVLPLRMSEPVVELIDEVWRRHGIKSRTAFIREAMRHYLESMGEADVAQRVMQP